jgi:hypothetical protein
MTETTARYQSGAPTAASSAPTACLSPRQYRVLAAAAAGYELGALSRRAERRRPPSLPALQQPAATLI